MMLRKRLGMTLIELVLSIALLGMVILGLHGLTDALMLADNRLSVRVADAERRGIGHRLLFDLLARAKTWGDADESVFGTSSEATLRSWCESSVGLLERCSVRLRLRREAEGDVLDGILADVTVIPLVDGPRGMRLIYLDGPDLSGRWLQGWSGNLDTPSAIGVVRGSDTLIVPVGAAR